MLNNETFTLLPIKVFHFTGKEASVKNSLQPEKNITVQD